MKPPDAFAQSEIIRVESYQHRNQLRYNVVLDLNPIDYALFSEQFQFQSGKLTVCPFCKGTKILGGPDSIEIRGRKGLPLNECYNCGGSGLYPEKLLQDKNPEDPTPVTLINHQPLPHRIDDELLSDLLSRLQGIVENLHQLWKRREIL